MGVGKSTIGRQLAQRLSMNFVDTDELIEQLESRSVQEIFQESGEEYFRTLETTLINETNFSNSILSVGGGLPCFNENLERLKEIGFTVYLNTSPEKLAERLWVVRKKRPLLKDVKSIQELVTFISTKLKMRDKYYKNADLVLDINDKASCEVVEELVVFVKELNFRLH